MPLVMPVVVANSSVLPAVVVPLVSLVSGADVFSEAADVKLVGLASEPNVAPPSTVSVSKTGLVAISDQVPQQCDMAGEHLGRVGVLGEAALMIIPPARHVLGITRQDGDRDLAGESVSCL